MAATDNIDIGKSSWPKWLVAFLIGAPVTVGIGYYYMKKKKPVDDLNPDKNGKVKVVRKAGDEIGKIQSTESLPKEPPLPQTPLQKTLVLKNLGNDFFKNEKYEDAMKCYTEALSVCPANERQQLAIIYQNRAAAHEVLNDMDEVLADCSRAIELNPTYIKALSRRIKVAEKLGKFRLGLEDVTALCILERFENITTLNHADRLLKTLGSELAKEVMLTKPPISPSKFFIQSYLKTFVNDPTQDSVESDAISLKQAKKALNEGRLDDAIQGGTERLAETDASGESKIEAHYIALLLRATALLLSGRPPLALLDLDTIITDKPPYTKVVVNAYVKRANLHLQLEDLKKCLDDFSQAEKLDPTNVDIFHQRAQVYLYSDRLEDAFKDYEKVVTLQPDFGLGCLQRLYTRYRIAVASREVESVTSAIAQLAAAAEKYSDVPEGFLLLGQVYADEQNFEAASKAFDQARKQNPQIANVLVHKGLLELQWHNNGEQAIEYLEEAIEVDNKCGFAYETLASIEVQRGNLIRGVELFSKALNLAKCEKEVSHISSLKAAAEAQQVIAKRLGLPNGLGIRF